MSQIARNLTYVGEGMVSVSGKGYLIHDRDPLFTTEFVKVLADVGVKTVKTTSAITEPECLRRALRPQYQRILSGAADPFWREVFADSCSKLRGALPQRAQPPGSGQPTDLPGTGRFGKHRHGPAPQAFGRHAELLLPSRSLNRQSSKFGAMGETSLPWRQI